MSAFSQFDDDAVMVEVPETIAEAAGVAHAPETRAEAGVAHVPDVAIAITSERAQVAHSDEHTQMAMVSLKAPVASVSVSRPPLQTVVVCDRSGSMSGPKIKMMKETLSFLVAKGMEPGDSLSLVSFDNQVEVKLPLTKMDSAGRRAAEQAIACLAPGGTTNLSGGLLQGIDLLQQAPPAERVTRAVLLFTDGKANVGITDPDGLISAVRGVQAAASSPATIFTFGFGADHQEELLRAIAGRTNGLYYFIDKTDAIPQAFADCLGGLISVVAQNATLTLQAAPSAAKLGKLHCDAYVNDVAADGSQAIIKLGDLYSEDEKDLLLQLKLPALSEPIDALQGTISASLRYFCVQGTKMVEVSTELGIARPLKTPEGQPIVLHLEEQRMRVEVAAAMEQARKLADAGRIDQGRATLLRAVAATEASPAWASPQVQQLHQDLQRLELGYENECVYRSAGAKMTSMTAECHMQQRSNYETCGVYEKAAKRAYKSSWR
mmetsp:Transcript_7552/g.12825  ORF Transcript_7552/g.12825 Transcript_7552/m.12825 type:complete len:492 (+) Transcript_7552:19-1494(+)